MEQRNSTFIKLEHGYSLNDLIDIIVNEFNNHRTPVKVALYEAEDVYSIVMDEVVELEGATIRVGSELKRELERRSLPQGRFDAEQRTRSEGPSVSFFEPYSTFLVYHP